MRAAIAFLTRVPVGAARSDEPVGCGAPAATRAKGGPGAAWFGVVGAGIGVFAALPILVLGSNFGWPAAVLAIAVTAIVSGALHLDGLADTADALAAPDPERAELARRDPRTGAAGVSAVVLMLVLDVLTLGLLLSPPEWGALVLVASIAASRGVLPLAAVLVGRGRRRGGRGLGGWFADRVSPPAAALSAASTAIPGAIALVAFGWRGPLVAAAAGVGGGIVAAVVIARLRHGLDGDGYGAVAELTTPIALLAATTGWQ